MNFFTLCNPNFCPGKVSGVVTSLPIIGGITASGVFLLFISVVGLIGAMKHHQVMLFFYMVVLFFIFIIQFSCSCAALSVSSNDQMTIIKGAWNQAVKHDSSKSLIVEAERQLDCCGLGLKDDNTFYQHPTPEDHEWSVNNTVFTGNWKRSECANIANINTTCTTCFPKISSKVKRLLQWNLIPTVMMTIFRFKVGLMQLVVLVSSFHSQR